MDLGTAIGMLVGFGLVVASILMGGTLGSFINVPGLTIVVGGTFAAAMIAEQLGTVLTSFKIAAKAFLFKSPKIDETIKALSHLATIVRKEGLLALENEKVDNEYLAKGVRMAVDGVSAEDIRFTLKSSLASLKARHARGKKIFKFMCATAPAMGMVGTLIGLVQMLQAMDDPASIGPAMAVALLTTLYGAVMAFMVFGPISEKLSLRSQEESENLQVILDGIDSVLKGENARLIQEKLEVKLPPKDRTPSE